MSSTVLDTVGDRKKTKPKAGFSPLTPEIKSITSETSTHEIATRHRGQHVTKGLNLQVGLTSEPKRKGKFLILIDKKFTEGIPAGS